MDPTTVRLIAGVLAVLLVVVLFMRRRSRKAPLSTGELRISHAALEPRRHSCGTVPGVPAPYVIPSATAITTAQPITLYQSQETSVKYAVAKIAASPASIPQNTAVPRTFGNRNASTKHPSSDP